ncbi:MAG: hypothetical protein ABF679_09940 [Lentilactobacillus diolivorans]|uniref:Uncharacterized protein n=2 Tax=Lentilactobacillus diolivorans TaxID=179838 RepID=A0A0R1SHT7_9LACO|nr:hypothetical protein [Lentilactobacillus diolivorans]KRL64507.1 hypothetical protein FC85_GL001017 [Lentilactobacillus diolivorans DSM 14421]MDH5106084.1 hypothetical protein [Lentilactobacillus diolivorans]RRG00630.1 MAG: hypothetical protein DUD34_14915 [Lactobacillus sp.]GEP22924.1 hypothetical protein LDI01_05170 [Lentilactobacillus diolivorans]
MTNKLPRYNNEQWEHAKDAVLQEYEDYKQTLRQQGVDYTIKNARKLLIYQDLVAEWQHKLGTVISDLEDNVFALTIFDDLKKRKPSSLLARGYTHISNWPDFNPTALALWLELEEDEAMA